MAAGEDREPDHMHVFFERGLDDLGRREADAAINDFHAGVAGAHRDLLGAVGMTVEAGLADKKFDAPPELLGNALDVGAQRVHAFGRAPRGAGDAGRRAIFAEHFAEDAAPFAGGDAGLRARDRCRHDIAAFFCSAFELFQRRSDSFCVA